MKKWMKYVKPYLLYFILGPLCMIVEVVGEVLMPLYLAEVINGMIPDAVTGVVPLTVGGSMTVMVKMD